MSHLSPEELDDFTVRPFTERAARFMRKLLGKKKPAVQEIEATRGYYNLPRTTRISKNENGQLVAHWPDGGTSIIPGIPGNFGLSAVTPMMGLGSSAIRSIVLNSYSPGHHNSRL